MSITAPFTSGYVLTASGTSTTAQGQSNLTFSGSALVVSATAQTYANILVLGAQGGTYYVSSNDFAVYHLVTNTTAIGFQMPQTSSPALPNGWYCVVRNMPASSNNLTVQDDNLSTIVVLAPSVTSTILYNSSTWYFI
jgi:hypothetical protein